MADSEVVATPSPENNSTNDQVAGENGQPQEQAQARPGFFGILKSLIVRMVFIYMISSFFRRPSTTPVQSEDGQAAVPYSENIYPKDTLMDLFVYISLQEEFTDFNNPQSLFWQQKGLMYGDWTSGVDGDGSFVQSGQIPTPEVVQNNGSIYLHVYFVRSGKSPNPEDKAQYSRRTTVYKSMRLNKFKKRKFHNTVNLLTGQTDVHPDLIQKNVSYEILSHWHPNLTINLLDDHSPWMRGSIPAPLNDFVEFVPGTNKYFPVLYFNQYWNLNTDYQPINSTVEVLNLTLTYSPISLLRWQMYAAQGMRSKWYANLGMDFIEDNDEDQDTIKTAFLETNPYLLALTIIISIVHSVFEFLAFKNDIQFWKNRKSLEGLSVRSVFFNVFQSLIVVLYVLDNETNFMVQLSVIVGLGIEIWKIHKVVNVKVDRDNLIMGVIPRLSFDDKSTYTESQTKKYDMMAFKYLSWALFPLLGGYAVYSLFYQEHKGWYSWVLSMMYGFLLTFGFIMMTPQLFINYKLKSVAHLPWRMMTYKALNTFIDDIFAFVIKMPTLYRIGCFRDDIVFFIFLYQRYIYRIDPKRVNEYGTSQEMFDQNGTAIVNDQNSVPIKNAESSQSELASDTSPSEETIAEPKSEEEKKND
ncbi:cleft lip and palate transmembrane protein 1 homolog [Pecten maximus]|uniref:cleft lip and palate transmembrane protein 1 homolog n=1 Tax=Pecten maximus TaxID=6579 RepID=UPI001458C455|nr:cleft lip and palate transmembrane protein 1 homolog [Pecten maximus]